MIEAILVDDERPALSELQFMLKAFDGIHVAGTSTNPVEALRMISEIKPQAIFLDIQMPQLQGMEAAAKIQELSPNTEIVFVTAYEQYTIEAFELQALDYLLKPLSQKRLEKTVERLYKKFGEPKRPEQRQLLITCMGSFQIGWKGEEPIRWRTEKTRELAAFLVHHYGKQLAKDQIIDAVWEQADGDRALHQLHSTVYYIRKALEEYGVPRELILVDKHYGLILSGVMPDVHTLSTKFALQNPEELPVEACEDLIGAYTGDYLEGEGWSWAEPLRESLRSRYIRLLQALSERYLANGRTDQAEDCLLRLFEKDPYSETAARTLLLLYAKTGNKAKAAKHYQNYKTLLANDLGIKPGKDLDELITKI